MLRDFRTVPEAPPMRPRFSFILLFALCAAHACVAVAVERPSLQVREAANPVKVDGRLDEPAWAEALAAHEFLLMTPREGQAPDESTRVSVLREGDRLVFGIWCQASRKPHAGLVPRDQV